MSCTDNLAIFWEKGFGDDPKSAPPLNGVDMTVDLDDLLEKGERFYKLYHDSLNFVTPGNSNVDSIRMMVIVHYTTTWTAYGGGYDDVIGALWVNPATMKPVGQTIAHEFGHSFQYQVYCDDPNYLSGQSSPRIYARMVALPGFLSDGILADETWGRYVGTGMAGV